MIRFCTGPESRLPHHQPSLQPQANHGNVNQGHGFSRFPKRNHCQQRASGEMKLFFSSKIFLGCQAIYVAANIFILSFWDHFNGQVARVVQIMTPQPFMLKNPRPKGRLCEELWESWLGKFSMFLKHPMGASFQHLANCRPFDVSSTKTLSWRHQQQQVFT